MKIGITERGDAGINFEWERKLHNMDGAVLISKKFSNDFIDKVLAAEKPLVLHCTCTGYGGTKLEPCVPYYKDQLNQLAYLIKRGFNPAKCVLRIDPIFPSEKGLDRVREVLDHFISLETGITRIRISLVDEYPHVKVRYRKNGWTPLYGDDFGPSDEQIRMVSKVLSEYDFTYETCAETKLSNEAPCFIEKGCISETDLILMNLPVEEYSQNPQNRRGCHCLSCKTELLDNKHPCPNGCLYCYWKN